MPIAHLKTAKLHYLQLDPSCETELAPQHLVMVHGLATSLAFWYHLTPALALPHRLTLFDLRGHGRSSMPERGYLPAQMAEDLKELLDQLGIEAAHLMGHSFGGSVVLQFAVRYPERVRSLILVDVRLKAIQPRQRLRDWPRWARIRRLLAKIEIYLDEADPEAGYQILEAVARIQLRTPPGLLSRRRQRVLARLVPKGSQRTAARWLELLETTTARRDLSQADEVSLDQLKRIKQPILAVYGSESPTLPTALALQALWPQAQVELVPGAGHFFPIAQPQKLIVPLQNFLLTT